ncbi:efflux RND transporter periplasmic adaptor subunit [Fodinibius sp.]|uniref:efflux RND transporter periplasmic adaptor subunit n=1 Tax=Fodinibius sp. TaxID=1872440 RepID=UPI002ACE7159|nr:efflux RND transporter periplasmic adaptor subunit [Fodinibius sp.]MDZ7659273.1 efflux RND transporter periplasmic adaptor subunit [Fodinibius sp.]
MSRKKKSATKKLLYVGIGLVVLLGIGALLGKTMGWLGGEPEAKQVEVTEAKLKTITQIVSASGKMQPEVEVILRPEVSGEIIELPIKEGDYVKQGELLVRIKPDIYQARIDETNAMLLTQKARMEQARASLLEAESVYKQNKQLFEKGAISEKEFIQSETNYEAQKANFNAAKYQVQSSEAQLEQAKEELQKTIIRSPRSGTISKLAVEVGERVLGNTQSIGTELLRIANMDQMEVQVQVNENDIVNVSTGDTANIEVDAYPERSFNGVVTEIANSAEISGEGTNEQVTNYEVKIRVATPHNLDMVGDEQLVQQASQEMPEDKFVPSFKPGMSATVDVQTQTVRNVVSVLIQAVTVRDFADENRSAQNDTTKSESDTTNVDEDLIIPEEDMRKVVFVVEDGEAKRKEVTTGISDNTHIQILSGLEAGEQVVTGSYRMLSRELSDGDKVNVNNNKIGRMASN